MYRRRPWKFAGKPLAAKAALKSISGRTHKRRPSRAAPRTDRNDIHDYAAQTRMLLFQSVDLEGSTGYKQRNADGQNQRWLSVITDFLQEFPALYRATYDSLQSHRGHSCIPEPGLWKVLGDELVYRVEVSRGEDVKLLTSAFRDALAKYNATTNEQHRLHREQPSAQEGGTRLRVKGSSWTAGFPVTNAVIHTGRDYDYIGPSMDMGFRLGALATPQRLAISVELAWLLGTFEAPLRFHFAGRTTIKGVAEGIGYPHLWIDVPSSKYYAREFQFIGAPSIEPHEVAELCGHFIKEHAAPSYLPFLKDEEQKAPRPANYDDQLKAIRDNLASIYLRDGNHHTDPRPKKRSKKSDEQTDLLARL